MKFDLGDVPGWLQVLLVALGLVATLGSIVMSWYFAEQSRRASTKSVDSSAKSADAAERAANSAEQSVVEAKRSADAAEEAVKQAKRANDLQERLAAGSPEEWKIIGVPDESRDQFWLEEQGFSDKHWVAIHINGARLHFEDIIDKHGRESFLVSPGTAQEAPCEITWADYPGGPPKSWKTRLPKR